MCSAATSSNGEGHLGLVLNFFDPHSCTKGYETTRQRPGSATSEIPANRVAYCAEPSGSATDVRGAENAPYAGKPVSPAQPRTSPASPAPPAGRAAAQQAQLPGLLGLGSGDPAPGIGQLLGLP